MEEIILKSCKSCKLEKNTKLDFRFHSATGYFSNTCIECENLNRRKQYIPKPKKPIVRFKQCSICKESKERNEESFILKSQGKRGKVFSKCCKVCFSKLDLSKKRRYSDKDETVLKRCNKCNEEKPLSLFYYHFKLKTHSYCCIQCESIRKKEYKKRLSSEELSEFKSKNRKYFHKNKANNLLLFYKKFDFERNYITNVTKDFIKELLNKDCIYCGYPPTGLDRIENTKGHTIENCVPCCKECNTAKMNNFSHEEMKIIGKSIKEVKDNRKVDLPGTTGTIFQLIIN